MAHGMVGTTVKGGMKAYLVVSDRVQTALASVTGTWSDLVAEVEHEQLGVMGAGTAPAPSEVGG